MEIFLEKKTRDPEKREPDKREQMLLREINKNTGALSF